MAEYQLSRRVLGARLEGGHRCALVVEGPVNRPDSDDCCPELISAGHGGSR